MDEVYVSYDQGRNQRLSDRWRTSPASTTSASRSHRSPTGAPSQQSHPAQPGESSTAGIPGSEEGTAGSWTPPLRSLLGSPYTGSSASQSRRETNLQPYTPGMDGSHLADDGIASSAALPSVEEDKAAQLRYVLKSGSGIDLPASADCPPRLTRHPSIVPDSKVVSVLGAPPSERRESGMTQGTSLPHEPPTSIPRTRPTVTTDLAGRHASSPASAVSSATPGVNSAMPLLAYSPEARRTKSIGGLSAVSGARGHTEQSAARSDSDIIPFETFLASRPP